MTDKQLEYIVAIASEGNITRAASKLYVSQSSLSQILTHVENEIGTKIFTRSSPLVPTYAGELFINSAKQILEIKQSLFMQFKEIENCNSGRIHIGMSQSRSQLFASFIIPDYLKLYPNVEIIFTEGRQQELNDLLLNGKIDFIFTVDPQMYEVLNYHILFKEKMFLILSNDSPLCSSHKTGDNIDLSLLSETPFILMRHGNNLRTLAEHILSDAKLCPNVIIESQSMDVCFQMASNGLGATIVPDTLYYFHKYRENVQAFPMNDEYDRPIAIAYRKNMYLPFIMTEFIRISANNLLLARNSDL
ncbi:MAG: LysR family transcriptional regulator [Clostridiaceae bacterium]